VPTAADERRRSESNPDSTRLNADPERFVAVVEDFVAPTRPGRHDPRRWRRLLRGAAAA
jgi:hypothetical protein